MCCFLGGGVSAYSSSSFPTVTEAPHVEVLCLARSFPILIPPTRAASKIHFFVTQSSIRASRSNSLEASLAELQSNINQMGRQMGLKLLALHLKSHTLVTPIWSCSKERSSSINDGYDNMYWKMLVVLVISEIWHQHNRLIFQIL